MKHYIEIGVLGGLLAVTLIGTYVSYHSDDKPDDGKGVDVYVASVSDLQKVSYETEKKSVLIERKSDERGEYLWLTVTERITTFEAEEVPEDTDASVDETDTDPPAEPTMVEVTEEKTKIFLGNQQADKLWEDFAPFQAARELPAGSDVDFGFAEPYGTLSVSRSSGDVEMTLGDATFGNRSRYLRAGTRTFLVEKKALTRIESASTSFPERRLHPLKYESIKTISATWEGQTRTWTHENAADKVRNYWAPEGSPETNARAASGWLSKAARAGAQEYLAEAPEGLTPVMSLSLSDGAETWTIEVSADGAESPKYYANSGFNRSMVSITPSQAEDLVVDVRAAFEDEGSSGEEEVAPPE